MWSGHRDACRECFGVCFVSVEASHSTTIESSVPTNRRKNARWALRFGLVPGRGFSILGVRETPIQEQTRGRRQPHPATIESKSPTHTIRFRSRARCDKAARRIISILPAGGLFWPNKRSCFGSAPLRFGKKAKQKTPK